MDPTEGQRKVWHIHLEKPPDTCSCDSSLLYQSHYFPFALKFHPFNKQQSEGVTGVVVWSVIHQTITELNVLLIPERRCPALGVSKRICSCSPQAKGKILNRRMSGASHVPSQSVLIPAIIGSCFISALFSPVFLFC